MPNASLWLVDLLPSLKLHKHSSKTKHEMETLPCSLVLQEGQGVHGELFSGANPPMLRITNIQRLQVQYCAFICSQLASSFINCLPCLFWPRSMLFLQQNLKLILKFSVTVDGERKEGTVTHELQHKPLFACLLEHNAIKTWSFFFFFLSVTCSNYANFRTLNSTILVQSLVVSCPAGNNLRKVRRSGNNLRKVRRLFPAGHETKSLGLHTVIWLLFPDKQKPG